MPPIHAPIAQQRIPPMIAARRYSTACSIRLVRLEERRDVFGDRLLQQLFGVVSSEGKPG